MSVTGQHFDQVCGELGERIEELEAKLVERTVRAQDAERDRDVARTMLETAKADIARLTDEILEAKAIIEAHEALLAKAVEFDFGPVTVLGHPAIDQWNVRHNGDGSLYRAKGADDFVMSRDVAVAIARELEAEGG